MQIDQFLMAPGGSPVSQGDAGAPLALVDLDRWPEGLAIDRMTAAPLIGFGNSDHPQAGMLDAMVEPPITADMLIRGISRAPHAAAVLVQLLRSIGTLSDEAAFTAESLAYGLLQGSAEHVHWLASRAPAELSPPGRVIVERVGAHLHITLDRPWARNAIDRETRDRLVEAFTVASLDPDVQSIMLRSVGPIFSIGGDLEEFGTTRDPAVAHLIRSQTLPARALAPRAGILDVHVQGGCVGAGLEIAAFASRLTAARTAWFQLPELAMGLIPGAGGCVSVPRRIGRQRAALMILSGRRINAATALRWGLIDAIEDQPAADEGGANQIGG
ncbi:Enoyl-CoA hydratase/carnithine racemase [Sphingomonas sp. YR710]|uniref:enoyl-CoA hydratase/isomerase family protein n=1 Tax=Sphingomonas sp. YR710 TaxID=1882773 RepID=UPI00087FC88B|nr:enoyl-CoA hydratase/isomerase family protein [Sphingomonas sp. YR710]SDC53614.1 Enoyl-CoA hydratase/carnithine racemase [Sphingomonas sp. YR710]